MLTSIQFTILILFASGHPWIALLIAILTGTLGFTVKK